MAIGESLTSTTSSSVSEFVARVLVIFGAIIFDGTTRTLLRVLDETLALFPGTIRQGAKVA